mmetsp:Transcript_33993/g.100962  ORF Transcript_33993/g.100962 Transcript_33993/m.100962 type:complete len:244 (-) Transcript_33993:6-737(-)
MPPFADRHADVRGKDEVLAAHGPGPHHASAARRHRLAVPDHLSVREALGISTAAVQDHVVHVLLRGGVQVGGELRDVVLRAQVLARHELPQVEHAADVGIRRVGAGAHLQGGAGHPDIHLTDAREIRGGRRPGHEVRVELPTLRVEVEGVTAPQRPEHPAADVLDAVVVLIAGVPRQARAPGNAPAGLLGEDELDVLLRVQRRRLVGVRVAILRHPRALLLADHDLARTLHAAVARQRQRAPA